MHGTRCMQSVQSLLNPHKSMVFHHVVCGDNGLLLGVNQIDTLYENTMKILELYVDKHGKISSCWFKYGNTISSITPCTNSIKANQL